ncbi:MAG: export ABC transporter ATP-binding protein, partial [Acidimicrobiia bacterium]|nr:export ABC transporter ATP-binding protein [Acidimicrobiia bacterium]
AERLCDRIGIVDQGELIAEGSQADLVRIVGQRDRLTLTATGSLAATAIALGGLAPVDDAAVTDDGIALIVDRAHDHLPEILAVAGRTGSLVKSVDVDSADLESVFLKLTGRALRE